LKAREQEERAKASRPEDASTSVGHARASVAASARRGALRQRGGGPYPYDAIPGIAGNTTLGKPRSGLGCTPLSQPAHEVSCRSSLSASALLRNNRDAICIFSICGAGDVPHGSLDTRNRAS
jgi:hypothetical protein